MRKHAAAGKGTNLALRKTQIEKTPQREGKIFGTLVYLARLLVEPALCALGPAGLSFGAGQVLNKIFGKGYGPQKNQLYKFASALTTTQKKHGGFLGMLASIGIPMATEAIKGLFGKGMHVDPSRPRPPPASNFGRPSGRGMHVNPYL